MQKEAVIQEEFHDFGGLYGKSRPTPFVTYRGLRVPRDLAEGSEK